MSGNEEMDFVVKWISAVTGQGAPQRRGGGGVGWPGVAAEFEGDRGSVWSEQSD